MIHQALFSLAEDSHKISSYFFRKIKGKVSSSAMLLGSLRVKGTRANSFKVATHKKEYQHLKIRMSSIYLKV